MKNIIPTTLVNLIARPILILTVISAAIFPGSVSTAYAEAEPGLDSCGQLLADAEARFLSTLPEDGSVPVTPETEAAAQEYIRVSKLCYEELEAQNLAGDDAHEGTPTFIDDGGVIMESESSAEFTTTAHKWGSSTWGTSGGTVTYSFMGNGLNLSSEPNFSNYGSSVAISSLPGFQACFITDIRNAFAAWQAVSNIQFVQVTDSGSAFNAPGAGGDIRIGAHTFDGPSGVLAHAYYPPPNGASAAGDMHFDRQENWTCNTSGIDIGVVALHEIGHSLGLGHETTSTLAVMDPYYNPSLTNLQSDDVNGAAFIYGASQLVAPSNDDFDNATVINSIAFTDSLNVIDATEAVDDPDGINPCSSPEGNKNLNAGWKTVWYKYTPQVMESISLDTLGSNYDTFIAVWTGTRGALNLVQCNEDTFEAIQSELSFVGAPSTTYYIQIGEFSGLQSDPQPKPKTSLGNLEFHAYITNTNVNIGTALMGRYYVQNGTSLRRSFASVDNGPVRINRVDNTSIIAAIRAVWSMNGVYSSYSELMGLPKEQLSTEYYFPWYNNTTTLLDEQFRIGNVDTTATTIEVSAGGNTYTYPLPAGQSMRVSYPLDTGPVRIRSLDGKKIIAAMRAVWKRNGVYSSYSEMMGLPKEQLSTEYYFPWYNNTTTLLDEQFRIGNVDTTATTIEVSAGGNTYTYPLPAGQSMRIDYPLNTGPVRIRSLDGKKIIAAMRAVWKRNGVYSSYSEMMGLPKEQLSTEYYFPWYNNTTNLLDEQFRIGNVDTTATTIVVSAGGNTYNYPLPAGQSMQVSYNLDTGPVRIRSLDGKKIIAAMRAVWSMNGVYSSYSELMGLPKERLSNEYYFPWYNNAYPHMLDEQLRFGVP